MRSALALICSYALCAMAPGQATTNTSTGTPSPSAAPTAAPKGNAIPRFEPPPSEGGWWNDAVFYQVFLRSFADSTEGPLAGDGIGDIQGLIEKLDYLNDEKGETGSSLGITALWLMPIHPSPSYHGYDVIDYRGINPQYGTLDDFKRLVSACHARGIRIVIDLVPNHCSSEHPWFKAARASAEAPQRAMFKIENVKPSWKGPWNQTVWHPLEKGAAQGPYYYGLFSPVMPDLEYTHERTTEEMFAITRFWLDEIGIDGFRLDAIRHLIEDGEVQENTPATHAWLKRYRTFVKGVKPDAFSVGEVWTASVQGAPFLDAELDSVFSFDLAGATLGAALHARAAKLADTLEHDWRLFPRGQFSTFLANHDQPRALTQLLRGRTDNAPGDKSPYAPLKQPPTDAEARAMAAVAAAIQFALPGVPFIYYGEEIGMVGDKPDENIRTPMQWTAEANAGFTPAGAKPWRAANADAATVNVAAQHAQGDSLLNLYRRLVHIRRGSPALTRGGVSRVEASTDKVFACLRTPPADSDAPAVLVVANLSGEAITDCTLSLLSGTLPPVVSAVERLRGDAATTPTLTPLGRFAGYAPLTKLEARTVYYVELGR